MVNGVKWRDGDQKAGSVAKQVRDEKAGRDRQLVILNEERQQQEHFWSLAEIQQ